MSNLYVAELFMQTLPSLQQEFEMGSSRLQHRMYDLMASDQLRARQNEQRFQNLEAGVDTFTNHQSQINIQKFKNTINQLKLSLRNIQNYKQMAPEILQILLKKVYQDSLHSLS